uniref:PIN domain-containing protein n=1 Tax=Thermofilum pendens TaxID=2269 RepID=A0A7C4FF45_THEPE
MKACQGAAGTGEGYPPLRSRKTCERAPAPLTASILRRAERLEEPWDLEDRIHVATMLELGITTIISNDEDFDDVEGI